MSARTVAAELRGFSVESEKLPIAPAGGHGDRRAPGGGERRLPTSGNLAGRRIEGDFDRGVIIEESLAALPGIADVQGEAYARAHSEPRPLSGRLRARRELFRSLALPQEVATGGHRDHARMLACYSLAQAMRHAPAAATEP